MTRTRDDENLARTASLALVTLSIAGQESSLENADGGLMELEPMSRVGTSLRLYTEAVKYRQHVCADL